MDLNLKIYIYIIVTGAVSYAIRALPLTLIRKEIKNKFIKSFLYYVPYVTLAVMTFPAIIYATTNIFSGISALLVGILISLIGGNLITVATLCCITVYVLELFL